MITKIALRRVGRLVIAGALAIMGLMALDASPAAAATGGGCSGNAISSIAPAAAYFDSCISSSNATSGYYFSAGNPSLWQNCTITIKTRDDTLQTTVVQNTYSCLSVARYGNYYQGESGYLYSYQSGHCYHSYVFFSGEYNGQWFGNTSAVNSPELYM